MSSVTFRSAPSSREENWNLQKIHVKKNFSESYANTKRCKWFVQHKLACFLWNENSARCWNCLSKSESLSRCSRSEKIIRSEKFSEEIVINAAMNFWNCAGPKLNLFSNISDKTFSSVCYSVLVLMPTSPERLRWNSLIKPRHRRKRKTITPRINCPLLLYWVLSYDEEEKLSVKMIRCINFNLSFLQFELWASGFEMSPVTYSWVIFRAENISQHGPSLTRFCND